MNWAKSFVQVPVPPKISGCSSSPFNDVYLDHMIATLAVILLPVKDRDKFLEQVIEDEIYNAVKKKNYKNS